MCILVFYPSANYRCVISEYISFSKCHFLNFIFSIYRRIQSPFQKNTAVPFFDTFSHNERSWHQVPRWPFFFLFLLFWGKKCKHTYLGSFYSSWYFKKGASFLVLGDILKMKRYNKVWQNGKKKKTWSNNNLAKEKEMRSSFCKQTVAKVSSHLGENEPLFHQP